MKSSYNSLDVFDFKEEDELPELTAVRYTSKFGNPNPNAIDKDKFLENDNDAIDSGYNYDSAVSYASLDAGEDCATKRMSGLDAVPQINCTIADLPEFGPNKLEPPILFSGVEGSTGPGAASTGYNCLSESSSSDEAIDMVSDADESMSERSPSTSSGIAEDDVPLDGLSSDHCYGDWEMGDGDMAVVFFPDYIIYQDKYCTDSVLTFSSSCIELKGSTAYGNQGTFNFQWGINDIIDIESQWCGRFEMAMVKIRVNAVQAGDVSGIEALKFAVVDSDWYEKQEAVTSLDVRYKALWNIVLDSVMERDAEALLGENGVSFRKGYFPDFVEPFEDVIYPKGDSDAVSIGKRDVDLLQPDTFVNDTIIDFYIKYLKNKIQPEERHRFHFFNSFFFRKLADLDKDPSSASEGRAAFQRVRKWTRKANLFEKDFVFIPVNFNYHWSLLVLCHLGEVAKFQDHCVAKSLKVPCILHMDSIKGSHTGLKVLVQSYLWEEWRERQKETYEDISSRFFNLRFVSLELPQQQNSFDCGLFLLHYVELFLEQAPINFNPFKISKYSNFLNVDWFQPAEASLKRVLIQRLIYDLLENHSPEISQAAGSDMQCTFNCPKANGDAEAAVEFPSERCSPSKASDVNIPSSQDGQGIEISLLPMSSLKSSQCASDSGLVLREFLESGAAVGPFLDAQYQTFDQTASVDEFKSTVSPIVEEVEAGAHFDYSPTETGLQPPAGITPEVCVFPCSARDFREDTSWISGISVRQAEHADMDPLPEISICAPDNSLEVEVNESSQVRRDLNLEERIDQTAENMESLTECLDSTPCPSEMLNADSLHPVQMLNGNDNADPLTSCPNNLPGLAPKDPDMQENGSVGCDNAWLTSDASVSESDDQHSAKKMRLTPLEAGVLTRSLPKDLLARDVSLSLDFDWERGKITLKKIDMWMAKKPEAVKKAMKPVKKMKKAASEKPKQPKSIKAPALTKPRRL